MVERMNLMKTLAQIYCHFFGHELWFYGSKVYGRSGRIGYHCENGCGFHSPEVPGKPGEGY